MLDTQNLKAGVLTSTLSGVFLGLDTEDRHLVVNNIKKLQ